MPFLKVCAPSQVYTKIIVRTQRKRKHFFSFDFMLFCTPFQSPIARVASLAFQSVKSLSNYQFIERHIHWALICQVLADIRTEETMKFFCQELNKKIYIHFYPIYSYCIQVVFNFKRSVFLTQEKVFSLPILGSWIIRKVEYPCYHSIAWSQTETNWETKKSILKNKEKKLNFLFAFS